MGSEWKTVRLGDVASIRSGFAFKSSDWTGSGVRVVKIANLKNCRLDMDGCSCVSSDVAGLASDFALRVGDVLMSMTGYIGEAAIVRSEDLPAVLNQRVGVFSSVDSDQLDRRFLFYWLLLEETRQAIEGLGYGSAQPNVSPALIHDLDIALPPLPEQRRIAHILGALDDKIELNRRMSATLEEMARALFKSWFVDFDPVRAKAEGRDPGLPEHIADLFPDSFEDSELSKIPKGWEIANIGDLAEIVGGSTPKTGRPEYWDGGTHCWATPKDLSGLSTPVLLGTERRVTDSGLAQISSGLLPQGSVLLSSRAPIGYLAIAEVPVAINQGFIAMKPRLGISSLFLLRWAAAAQREILGHANGSTFLEISKSNFRLIRLVVPDLTLMSAFDRLTSSAYCRMVENERESRALAALRDTLLPKLISGEIRVRDADKIIEGVIR